MIHYIFLITSEFVCIHCEKSPILSILEMLLHCKTCEAVIRPDVHRYKFVCTACYSFHTNRADSMKNHLNVHLGRKPYYCKLCDYRAAEKNNVLKHVKRKHKKDEI